MNSLEGTAGSGAPKAETVHSVYAEDGGAWLGRVVADKYRIERILGEGGMGIVYLAFHCELEQPVAIKVIRAELAERESLVDRMLQEARTAAKFRSEHIARVLDVGRLRTGTPYLVLEYLEGENLASYLERHGPLPYDQAVSLSLQCCGALAEAHAAGIVHRDIKPDNLFLTTRSDGATILKVLDFGISKRASRAAESSYAEPVIGSPQYMAPEQMSATAPVDERADIWSVGVVLFEMLTGRLPFEALTIAETCSRVLKEPHEPLRSHRPDLPSGLQFILDRCFRKDPRERFATVADLATALAPYGQVGAEEVAERVGRVLAASHSSASKPVSARTRRIITPGSNLTPASLAVLATRTTSSSRRRNGFAALAAGVALGLGALLLLGGKHGDVSPSQASMARTVMATPAPARDATTGGATPEESPDDLRTNIAGADRPVVPVAAPSPSVQASAQASSGHAHEAGRKPTARSGSAKPAARTIQQATTSPAAALGSASASSAIVELPVPDPGPDAWDPSSFGGRK